MNGHACAGFLFQFPGLFLASVSGIGAANFLKDPAPWLRCLTSGGEHDACFLANSLHHPQTSTGLNF